MDGQGAFKQSKYATGNTYSSPVYPSMEPCDKIYFYASDSNDIYGNSSTVQPPSLTAIYAIKY